MSLFSPILWLGTSATGISKYVNTKVYKLDFPFVSKLNSIAWLSSVQERTNKFTSSTERVKSHGTNMGDERLSTNQLCPWFTSTSDEPIPDSYGPHNRPVDVRRVRCQYSHHSLPTEISLQTRENEISLTPMVDMVIEYDWFLIKHFTPLSKLNNGILLASRNFQIPLNPSCSSKCRCFLFNFRIVLHIVFTDSSRIA